MIPPFVILGLDQDERSDVVAPEDPKPDRKWVSVAVDPRLKGEDDGQEGENDEQARCLPLSPLVGEKAISTN